MLDNIQDIHILVEELDERIETVRSSCTIETGIEDIQSERDDYNESISDIRLKVEDAMKVLSAGSFGG